MHGILFEIDKREPYKPICAEPKKSNPNSGGKS